MAFWTYIVASARNGTLYTGSTDDLGCRLRQHRAGTFGGFTKRYGVHHLVWFEEHVSRDAAFRRERQIKEWKRRWKLNLIEGFNPDWIDLSETLDPSPGHVPYPDELFVPYPQTRLPRAGLAATRGSTASAAILGPGLRRDERD